MGACDDKGKGRKAMVVAIRVASDKEGKGNGIGNKGGVQQREQWLWRQEQWQQGWWVSDGNKGDGKGYGDNVGDCDGNKAGGQQRGQG
jgi:hypothetical protein